jgi:hypothetical protein
VLNCKQTFKTEFALLFHRVREDQAQAMNDGLAQYLDSFRFLFFELFFWFFLLICNLVLISLFMQ